MKVLFICSGKSDNSAGVVVKNQAQSLINIGVDVSIFLIKHKGLLGYIRSIVILRSYLRENDYDIYHAHYSLSGYVAAIAGAHPLITSLMGSDIIIGKIRTIVLKFFSSRIWQLTIVKSSRMNNILNLKNTIVIPNGVDLTLFKPCNLGKAQQVVNFSPLKKYVLFVADPSRPEKNYALAKAAIDHLDDQSVVLKALINIKHHKLPDYYNAAHLVLLTSKWEGSPNIIKEALACNTPIVSTNVGDVSCWIKGVLNCYITSDNPIDIANAITKVIKSGQRSNGRKKIKSLSSKSVAKQLDKVYSNVLNNHSLH